MPNHVTNVLRFDGDPGRVQSLLLELQNEEEGLGSLDFNKIIPMPKALAIESGSRTDIGLKAYRDFVEIYTLGREVPRQELLQIPEQNENAFLRHRPDIDRRTWDLGRQAFRNKLLFGVPTWYEWCVQNWGTKWNAYDCSPGDGSIEFHTAWSAPHPVIQKLSELYPELGITHLWADEDIGQNCGQREYQGGELTDEDYPMDGREACEFAADILGADLEDYGLVLNEDGTDYIYEEELGGMQL